MPLTASDAAALLGLAPMTFRQKLRDGVVPGRLEQGRWVVEEEDVASYALQTGRNPTGRAIRPPETSGGISPATGAADTGTHHTNQPRAEARAGAWLLLAVGEDRAFGSNDGYEDEPERHYRWDDAVPNHARIRKGDAVVLWDKKSSIGAAVVDSIETVVKTKPVYSCPHCGKAHIKARKTKQPRYRCFKCGENFDEPITTRKEVLEYTAFYETS